MDCPRCHHPISSTGRAACEKCDFAFTRTNYNQSPIKRGVRQGLLIIVAFFLLAALVETLAKTLHLPKHLGDLIAVLGVVAGVARGLQIAVLRK